jgi:nitrite reductase (NADH) small subunit
VLARGIVGDDGGRPKVACPQHKKTFDLERGDGLSDPELRISVYAARAENGTVYAKLPVSWPEQEGARSCGARCGG